MNAVLPDEFHALQTLVLEQQRQISRHQTELAAREAEIEPLKLVIAKLRRMEFGRRSERLAGMIGQLGLSLEELEGRRAEAPLPPVAEPPTGETAAPPHRNLLPAH